MHNPIYYGIITSSIFTMHERIHLSIIAQGDFVYDDPTQVWKVVIK